MPAARPDPPTSRPVVAYTMSRFPKLTETFILYELLAVERQGLRVELYPLLRERVDLMHSDAVPLVARARFQPFVSAAILRSQLHWLWRDPSRYLRTLAGVAKGTWGSANFFVGGLGIFPKTTHLARLMAADEVTHVHCHFANHPALAGWIVQRLTGIPYSFTAHGSDLHVDRHMLPQKVREAAFVVTVSEFNRDVILAECGAGADDKVHIVRCGVDTRLFKPSEDARRTGPLRILAIGTLHEVKGQAFLVEACRILRDTGIEVCCTLIGDGPDRSALQRLVAQHGLGASVRFAGRATRDEIVSQLGSADVLAVPSVPTRRGKREGLPVVLMEGMAAGVAVVASDLSGIPELVGHDVTGLLVPPRDPAALAAALRRLHDDEALRRRLGQAGRARVLTEYDLDQNAERLARLFTHGCGVGSARG